MGSVILAIARFRSNQKEAMSKNFVNLAEGMVIKGHRVTTVTPVPFESELKIKQHTFRKRSHYASLFEALSNLIKICFILNNLIKFSQPVKVNIHIATPVELLIISIFLKANYRKSITISIWQSYLTYRELLENRRYYLLNFAKYFHLIVFNSFLNAFLYRFLLKSFKHSIVHNRYQQQQLMSLSNKPVEFVQNGVFSENFSVPQKCLGDKLQLIYIGHVKPSKGVDALIELAATLKTRQHASFHLTICLSGFGRLPIKKLIQIHKLEKYITFKHDIDIVTEMTNADILILPLRTCVGTSLTPNVIVEAISCGLPIAVPHFSELQDIIKFGMNAIKLNLNNMEKSAETIEQVCNADKLISISRNQRQQFKMQLTLEHFVKGYTHKLNLD